HTRCLSDWSSDVCSSDLADIVEQRRKRRVGGRHFAVVRAAGVLGVEGRRRPIRRVRVEDVDPEEPRLLVARYSWLVARGWLLVEIGRASCRERVWVWGGA